MAMAFPQCSYAQASFGHKRIIFSELYPDPIPSKGLPEYEFIELLNSSDDTVWIDYWKLSDGVHTADIMGVTMFPEGRLILCPAKAEPLFSVFGKTAGLSPWPILNNTSDSIVLIDKQGNIIDALRYDISRLNQEKEKKEGGWTLEIIDPSLKCKGFENWNYSINPIGGTPGAVNSIYQTTPDTIPPKLTRAAGYGIQAISLFFDEPMNAATLKTAQYHIEGQEISHFEATKIANQVVLYLTEPLEHEKEYSIHVIGAEDCNGNPVLCDPIRFVADIIPPKAIKVSVCLPQTMMVVFSEEMDNISVDGSQFCIEPGCCALEATFIQKNHAALLTFPNKFEENRVYKLSISGARDLAGNVIEGQIMEFVYRTPMDPQFNNLVVSEIMATPGADHPHFPSEYIEIYNRTSDTIQLAGLSIADRSRSIILDPFEAPPAAYVIIAPFADAGAYKRYGLTLPSASWSGLNDRGDQICLLNRSGEIIFSIEYEESWYKDQRKKKGYSLEMIDTSNPCSGYYNWTSSEAAEGGTPGKSNSVAMSNPDFTPPRLIAVAAPSCSLIVLAFNEKVRSLNEASFRISPAIGNLGVSYVDEKLEDIAICTMDRLEEKKRYSISISHIEDCVGNRIDAGSTKDFYVCEPARSGSIDFNEVLVSPRAGGVEFIELYSCAAHPVDLTNWTIVVGKKEATLTSGRLVIAQGDFKVITRDPRILKADYPHARNDQMICFGNLPTLPNEEGVLVLKDSFGTTIDSMYYSRKMHHPMIKDDHGISLERISHEALSTDYNNWKSAAGDAGYATPGYKNSQSGQRIANSGMFIVEPPSFSPWDLSGRNHTLIKYRMGSPGFIANIIIYDRIGREVVRLANNISLGTEGSFRWDGLDDAGRTVASGYYIVFIEAFNLTGEITRFKGKVAVAAKE